ncbi:BREX-1 system adenine-specific DNA-methyltransferase PglX [Stutzerimonas stutzeri]|uniref:BREX-1 system adenine-specific DNA-methyltransferase PglX n=1 Tax=Stutzerimonas stutzeri TaxID=316 RepID=UPI0011D1F95C|nr:BREX-1 system adenine-specific DNA-methyltransferase PglX [Stutzerimonas stutzeri]QPT30972.1 BREX-1 system adenine-specific DNA-methyltransferase PglX [Stutzerimonas stutzeri]
MSQEQSKDMSQYFYRASAADFMKIPGSPVAYWVSHELRAAFSNGEPLKKNGDTRQGMATSDNGRFLRSWWEVAMTKLHTSASSREEAAQCGAKWFPYNKGGDFRKWYGNIEHVLNWENDGEEVIGHAASLYGSPTRTIKSISEYFKPSISWSKISSGNLALRYYPSGFIFDVAGCCIFTPDHEYRLKLTGFMNSLVSRRLLTAISPTLNFEVGHIASMPIIDSLSQITPNTIEQLIDQAKSDWDSYETSWDFVTPPLLDTDVFHPVLSRVYQETRCKWRKETLKTQLLEEENNRAFITSYSLQAELAPEVPSNEVTLTCNPQYRYGGNRSEEELETLLQCDTLRELVSYAIGCMMGRYSLDKPGLILASQGETLQDYLRQIPSPRFAPDDDAILPLTDQEWFSDDATHRFREFIRVVWGDENLQQNLDFVAESLCLHAIKPKKGENSLDTIRRYLSTQFFKDHLRTYKKRPIYWLFSSGKHKAFECLVYLHRYNEGTLARMRTEYVIPLTAKLANYAAKLEKDLEASTSTAEKKRLEKELTTLHNQQAELAAFDEKLRHYADQRISLDLDDGVKLNYGKFGDLLAEVKAVTGGASE